MHVLLLSNDLMTTSQIEGAVRSAGGEVSVATTVGKTPDNDQKPIDVVILDLSTTADVAATVSQFRERSSPPRIIAFGPHVHAAKLATAKEVGCDAVYTRGQFMPQVAAALGITDG